MIAVDKERLDDNGCRIWPGQRWLDRATAATEEIIKNGRDAGHEVRQEIYGSDTVRAALRELFFNKCAYCESLLVGGELDVDHYRPKAGVAGIPDHCGYYWLAYVWDNLLASCIFCNRLRKEPATWQSRTRGETAGKGNQFPIADERKRAWSPSDDVSLEDAMIVNPTTDEPAEHIGFDPLGHAIPLTNKGEASIEIFGLNARSLYT